MHRFHKSSFRPPLIMGGERTPMLALLLICLTVAVPGMNIVAFSVAGALWLIGHPLLAWMASVDPQMVSVFMRNRLYPHRIPAFTTPFHKPRRWF